MPTVSSAAQIAAAPQHQVQSILTGVSLTVEVGKPFSATLADLTLPAAPAESTRGVSIWWGDGTNSDSTLAPASHGYKISGGHAYAKAGTYKVWLIVWQKSADVSGHKGKTFRIAAIESTVTVE